MLQDQAHLKLLLHVEFTGFLEDHRSDIENGTYVLVIKDDWVPQLSALCSPLGDYQCLLMMLGFSSL